ncbi:MAG: DUF423 domain-containing protein [Gammaproteobacteria bacterium]
MYRWIIAIACLMGAGAVVLGALGAHAFRGWMSQHAFESYSTAVHYLMIHAVAILAASRMKGSDEGNRFLEIGMVGLVVGTLVFSGGLVGWTVGEWRWARRCAPWGGTILILAWLSLAIAALRERGMKAGQLKG